MKNITVPAAIEELDRVLKFVENELAAQNCPPQTIARLDIAVEEIFVNIAHYAYKPEVGDAEISVGVGGRPLAVTVIFADRGRPYNPLAKKDPDVSLSADERDVGGLGIFMVKKSMDEVSYAYENGKNILRIKKYF